MTLAEEASSGTMAVYSSETGLSFDESNESFKTYEQRFAQFVEANGIEQGKQRAVFLSVVGAKTFSLLTDLLAPKKLSDCTLEDLLKALREFYVPKKNVLSERYSFRARKQQNGETVAEYVAALKGLATTCEFGSTLDEQLRDQLVYGITSKELRTKLLSAAYGEKLKWAKVMDIVHNFESTTSSLKTIQQTPLRTDSVSSYKGKAHARQKDSERKQKPHAASGGDNACYRCQREGHSPANCKYKDFQCRACNKKGHLERACRSKESGKHSGGQRASARGGPAERDTLYVVREPPDKGTSAARNQRSASPTEGAAYAPGQPPGTENCAETESPGVTKDYELFTVKGDSEYVKPYMVMVRCNGLKIKMEVDTGAAMSVMSEKLYNKRFKKCKLQPCDVRLKTYSSEPIALMGQIQVKVQCGEQTKQLMLLVAKGSGPTLMGRNWIQHLHLDWSRVNHLPVTDPVSDMYERYSPVFNADRGVISGVKAKLRVMENANPKFCKARSVPYALSEAVDKQLAKLQEMGVCTPVEYSEWATPIVCIPKTNGDVRICGDYKVTINPWLEVDKYPLPKTQDLFAKLAGGKYFTKLDLTQAYQQVELDDESKQYLTINTPKGLYQMNRLPYGIASSPAIFQRIMDQILQGLPKVVCYLDDILITGSTEAEHWENVEQVLQRLQDRGIRVNRDKCSFSQPSVTYLGHKIDSEGLHPVPEKVEAIVNASAPKNVTELRAFLALLTYYGKFMENLSTIIKPMTVLLQKDSQWNWSTQCQAAFEKAKSQLASSSVLTHFDPQLPILLACDASAYGLGAVISHKMTDGSERPIAYASRTLSKTEINYSQIEKEALGIIFGVQKFRDYLYGRKFVLVTDHKPLVKILGPKTGVPALAAARLQRWALLLSAYQYDIVYKASLEHANADGLSRLPLQKEAPQSNPEFRVSWLESVPVSAKDIKKETDKDKILTKVRHLTQAGWPKHVSEGELKPYWNRRDELTVEADCVLWGLRVIIPTSLRPKMLNELHEEHLGIVRTKALARSYFWWPSLDDEIEAMVNDCLTCKHNRHAPNKAPVHPWKWPELPWERIHIDFAEKGKHQFLLVSDAYSRWPEVKLMASTTATATVEAMRGLFAAHGLPLVVVSDNGPQLVSKEFETFLEMNGVKHIKSAPYNPASNGLAERLVQTFKQSLDKQKDSGRSLQHCIDNFLFSYRNTPCSSTGKTPSQLFLKRNVRTRLSQVTPKFSVQMQEKQENVKNKQTRVRSLQPNQAVLVKNFRGGEGKKWKHGVIERVLGPLTYMVNIDGQISKKHIDQMIATKVSGECTNTENDEVIAEQLYDPPETEIVPGLELEGDELNEMVNEPVNVRPQRIRRAPERLTY